MRKRRTVLDDRSWLAAKKEQEKQRPRLMRAAEELRARAADSTEVSDSGYGSVRFLALFEGEPVEVEVQPVARERWEAIQKARQASEVTA